MKRAQAEYFDALAIHSYGFRQPPAAEPAPDRLNFRRAELLRQLMTAHGDGAKPAFITEFGWNDHPRWSGAVRPSQRSAYTIQAFEYAEPTGIGHQKSLHLGAALSRRPAQLSR